MRAKSCLLILTALASGLAGTTQSQIQRPGVGPTNPDRLNQDLETKQQIQLLEEQRQREELQKQAGQSGDPARDPAVVQAQVAKFMAAIKHRRHRFPDFDRVVLHSKTPVTSEMLSLMAESPYAADIAYYLGKHPGESGAIALMPPAQARLAVRQLEATLAGGSAPPD